MIILYIRRNPNVFKFRQRPELHFTICIIIYVTLANITQFLVSSSIYKVKSTLTFRLYIANIDVYYIAMSSYISEIGTILVNLDISYSFIFKYICIGFKIYFTLTHLLKISLLISNVSDSKKIFQIAFVTLPSVVNYFYYILHCLSIFILTATFIFSKISYNLFSSETRNAISIILFIYSLSIVFDSLGFEWGYSLYHLAHLSYRDSTLEQYIDFIYKLGYIFFEPLVMSFLVYYLAIPIIDNEVGDSTLMIDDVLGSPF